MSLLCDLDNAYAATLGLAAFMDEPLAQALLAMGIDLPLFQGARGWSVPIPATFVVDAQGAIVDRMVDPDYRRRPNLAALFEALSRAHPQAAARS